MLFNQKISLYLVGQWHGNKLPDQERKVGFSPDCLHSVMRKFPSM